MGPFRLRSPVWAALLSLSACAPAPVGAPVQPPTGSAPPPVATGPVPPASDASPATPASPTTPVAAARPRTILRGAVYDEKNEPVPDGTVLSVRSLDATQPFEARVTTLRGVYAVPDAPAHTQLEILANREGWTTRRRVEVLIPNERQLSSRNVINFGGRKEPNDPSGHSYYLSNRPEIESVLPTDGASSQSPEKLRFEIKLSEPLSEENQRRLAAAFLLVPQSLEALADGAQLPPETASAGELVGLRAGANPLSDTAYRFRQNSGYHNGLTLSEFRWTDSRTAMFSLDAPVKTDDEKEAKYAFLLVQQDDKDIVDAEALPLGMNAAGDFGGIKRGEVILNAVREPELSLSEGRIGEKAEIRWADTHLSYTSFSVAKDTSPPALVSVLARRNYAEQSNQAKDRLELRFSKPMLAFPQIASPQLLSLNNYVLFVANTRAEADTKKLDDSGTARELSAGASFESIRDGFRNSSGFIFNTNEPRLPLAEGEALLSVSPTDPKTVILSLPGGSLPPGSAYVRVLAGSDKGASTGSGKSVADAAGNAVDPSRNQLSGEIQ